MDIFIGVPIMDIVIGVQIMDIFIDIQIMDIFIGIQIMDIFILTKGKHQKAQLRDFTNCHFNLVYVHIGLLTSSLVLKIQIIL